MTADAIPEPNSRHLVAGRWRAEATGLHYASARFRGRRRDRDARLVAALCAAAGYPLTRPATRVLDAPAGTGRLCGALGRHARRVVALDVSRAMLVAGGPAPEHVLRVEASAFEPPFQSGAFEVAVSCRLLHHLADPADRRAVLRELARVASGHVIVSYWDAASWHAVRRRAGRALGRPPRDARVAVSARTFDLDLAAAGLAPRARRHSARFLSAQTFVLASVGGA